MEQREFLQECDLFLKRLQESPLSGESYNKFISSREWKSKIDDIYNYISHRNHLFAFDEFGDLNTEGKIFALSTTYTEEYDKEYNKEFKESIILENTVEEIPKIKWYRKATFLWTIIGILLSTIIGLLVLRKNCS